MTRGDRQYNQVKHFFGKEPTRVVVELIKYLEPDQRVLDLGGGDGRNSIWLAKQNLYVVNIDSSKTGIENARKYAEESNVGDRVNCIVRDITADTIQEISDDVFHAVVCTYVIENTGDQSGDQVDAKKAEKIINHIKQMVTPKGYAAIAFSPRSKNIQTGIERFRGYSEQQLEDHFTDWDQIFKNQEWKIKTSGQPSTPEYINYNINNFLYIFRKPLYAE